jgi:hypothetical protein
MKQAIAGVAPPDLEEVTVMAIWPSISALAGGRAWGRLYGIEAGRGLMPWGLTVGKLIAFASIPLILPAYFLLRLPGGGVPGGKLWWSNPLCRHYRLTNRRLVIEHPLGGPEVRSIALDDFDSVETVVLPGQRWYKSGELVFRKGQIETFRLSGVPRPETFRRTCLEARNGFVGVSKALKREAAHA